VTSERPLGPPKGLEADPEGARIVGEELRLLALTLEAAAGTRERPRAAAARVEDDARLLELRDEVAAAKPEDLPALFDQMHTLDALRARRGRAAAGTIDRVSPYFGHLRLEEKHAGGRVVRRDVLIGGRSYLDPDAGVRIVDWRHAPVSRIYYRYEQGDEYEEELGDVTVEGVVVARRNVTIVDGRLVRVSAPEGTYVLAGDGAWARHAGRHLAVLRGGRGEPSSRVGGGRGDASSLALRDSPASPDGRLPAIAAMLDKPQFELISRLPAKGRGVVCVQGSAGSGKTTVGLHRAAYLAFADPRRFRPARMLVVVPTNALVRYVARVLPELGVEGVPTATFARIGSRLIARLLPKLPTSVNDQTPPVVARAKSHAAMLGALEAVATDLAARLEGRLRESMGKWPEGERVVLAWEATSADTRAPAARVAMLGRWLAGKRSIAGVGGASELPDVTRGALERLVRELAREAGDVAAAWDEATTSRARLDAAFAGVPGFGPGQLDQVHAWCVRQSRIRAEGEREGDIASLDAEDVALVLRAWQLVRGPLLDLDDAPLRFAHIFVDEVQDVSPVELRVLLDMAGTDPCVTLAGDTAQRLLEGEGAGEFDWTGLLRAVGLDRVGAIVEPLHVSYRSTAEIASFARRVLGSLAHEVEPVVTRQGPPVELMSFASAGEAVAWLAEALRDLAARDPGANVALIARFAAQADLYYEGLARAEVANVRRVSKEDFSWEPGVDVTEVAQTKGLEFDEVVLLETTKASYPDTAGARRAIYVAATRAANELWCTSTGEPSPVVVTSIAKGTRFT
jgi:ATP-dependent DNA helicase UvrD/PcrA